MKILFAGLLTLAWALAFLRPRSRRLRRLQLTALSGVWLACWMPTAWLLNYTLEHPYLSAPRVPAGAEAIVLFSGGAWPPTERTPYPVPLTDTALRTRHAAWLYRSSELPVLVCGGPFSFAPEAPPVAAAMAEMLQGWGVSPADIILEGAGRSTYEQGLGAARLLREMGARRVLVVTERFHMKRAEGVLRKLGFETIPAGCGTRSQVDEVKPGHLLPGARALQLVDDAVREWAALAYYRLRERI